MPSNAVNITPYLVNKKSITVYYFITYTGIIFLILGFDLLALNDLSIFRLNMQPMFRLLCIKP